MQRSPDATTAHYEQYEDTRMMARPVGRCRRAGSRLGMMGIEGRGFVHDIMLYAFLLHADPGGCAIETLSERFLDRKLPIRTGFDMKMGDPGILLVEEKGFLRTNGLIQIMWFPVMRLIVSADYFHVHPSGQSLDAASTA